MDRNYRWLCEDGLVTRCIVISNFRRLSHYTTLPTEHQATSTSKPIGQFLSIKAVETIACLSVSALAATLFFEKYRNI
jgi:plastocyanin domain-containing protein